MTGGSVSQQPDTAVIAFQGVDVSLSGRPVLKDVDFSVARGQLTGLIGPNGAGKTTIFRVILGLVTPQSGEVRIDGHPRPRHNRLIGYVPQKVTLDYDLPLRGRDLVALGLDGDRIGIPFPSRHRRRLIDEMLEAVDARDFANSRVGQLSGGEQQRILIAHALVSKPKLLLLDEPLANLDLRSEYEVVALLSRVVREQRIAVLISAHDMNPLLPVMDQVVYVAAGRVASGTVDEVVRQDVLSALYGHHVDVVRVHNRILVVSGPDVVPEVVTDEGPFEQVM